MLHDTSITLYLYNIAWPGQIVIMTGFLASDKYFVRDNAMKLPSRQDSYRTIDLLEHVAVAYPE